MASQQLRLVNDNSSVASFVAWASAISAWFATCGWIQTADSGQVNWGTIAAVPAGWVYEIWKPGDGLQPFFIKIEYGDGATPNVRLTLSTATDGAGNPIGTVGGPWVCHAGGYTVGGSTASYECNFSGDSGRIGVMMWRDVPPGGAAAGGQMLFCIERSVDNAGNYFGTATTGHVTVVDIGMQSAAPFNASWRGAEQHTLLFGVGFAPGDTNKSTVGGYGAVLCVRGTWFQGQASTAFNGSIPVETIAPVVGYIDYPLTCLAVLYAPDIVEGVPFNISLYGSSRRFMPSKNGQFQAVGISGACIAMRYD